MAMTLDPKRHRRLNYWLVYTLAFILLMTLVLLPFWGEGRTLISSGDSASEFYPATIYIGRWYRQVLSNFLHGEFTLPMFDPNIVLGEDAYGLMTYYNLGNPLFFLTALVPSRFMHLFFRLSIPLQYYLAGAAFSLYCFYMKRGQWATLAGSLVYLSCGYMFKVCAMYIDFLTPLIYLPLLLIGFEAVLQKRSVLPLVFAAWYTGLNEIYFSYMCGIFLVFYGLVRGGELYGLRRVREWFLACLKAVGAFVVGFLLAMPFLLPSIACFFGSGRSGSEPLGLEIFLPDPARLKGLLLGSWMVTEGPGRNNIALCAIAILAVLLLVVRGRKRWPGLCVGALLAGGMYLLPFTDYLMSAFAGRYDRWVYLLGFVWALAVAYMFPLLLQLRPVDKLLLVAVVALAFGYGAFGPQPLDRDVLCSVAVLAFTVMAIFAAQYSSGIRPRQWGPALLCGAVLFNAALIGYWCYDEAGDGFATSGHEMEYVRESTRSAYGDFPQVAGQTGQNYRIDNRGPEINSAMLENYPGINGYWSLLNNTVLTGLQQMGVVPPGWNISLTGKSELVQTLVGVRYRITNGTVAADSIPGWQLVEQRGDHTLYENTHALPIAGYTYDTVLPQEVYEGLNAVEKQQMALRAVALEELPQGLPQADPAALTEPLPFTLTMDNVNYENGLLDLGWWSGSMKLQFQAPPNTRLMLYFKDSQALQEGITAQVSCGSESRSQSFSSEQADYVLDLGHSSGERTELTIDLAAAQSFELVGDVQIGELLLYALPEARTLADADALGETVLTDAVLSTNTVRGSIQLAQPRVLCIALPYSTAWTARVDGQEARLYKANNLFMALPLTAGEHTIELSYRTPGLVGGWALFGVGAVVLALLLVQQRRSARPAKKGTSNEHIQRERPEAKVQL